MMDLIMNHNCKPVQILLSGTTRKMALRVGEVISQLDVEFRQSIRVSYLICLQKLLEHFPALFIMFYERNFSQQRPVLFDRYL
jgi:hypothetical protein